MAIDPGQLTAQQIAGRLEQIGINDVEFGALMGILQGKAVAFGTVAEAAAFYIGGDPRWRTKAKALAAIRSSFEDRAYQAAKMAFVDKSTPW
jgi:hypothetical protein